MSEAPESYPAGVDVPGTPAPFPFGLVSFGMAWASTTLTFAALFSWLELMLVAVAAGIGWLVSGLLGWRHGMWKGFAAGLPVLLLPWVIAIVALSSGMVAL